jgi:hypothetical protein
MTAAERRGPRRAGRVALAAAVVIALAPAAAFADDHEVQWSARPFGGLADVPEPGASRSVAGFGGIAVGMSYGISNQLDLGGEILALQTMPARFAGMAVLDGGAPYHGPLERRTASTLLVVGPTWRFGASWVPVVALAAGGGARFRSAGVLSDLGIALDERRGSTVVDVAALARVGIEHRVNRRLTVGLYAQGLASWSPSAELLPMASVSLGLSYVRYHVASPVWSSGFHPVHQ